MKLRAVLTFSMTAFAGAMMSGCAIQYGAGRLPDAEHLGRDPYGAEIRLTLKGGERHVLGELLAVSNDSIYLSTVSGHEFATYARNAVESVDGSVYDRHGTETGLAIWTALGVPASRSTGFFSLILAPLYLIVGIPTAISGSYISQIGHYGDNWKDYAEWARFPEGLPANYNRAVHSGRH